MSTAPKIKHQALPAACALSRTMANCCSAYTGLEMLGTLCEGGKAIDLSRRRSSAQTLVQTLGNFPAELLPEVLCALSCSSYMAGIVVCRCWRKALDYEVLWSRSCIQQWPGATPHQCTWREFAMFGGGHTLGKSLLDYLITASNTLMKCPSGHSLDRFSTGSIGFKCDVCLKDMPHGMTMWACRQCGFGRCMACYNASQAPTELANGAVNCCTQEGWTCLHFASRLGFSDVSERLINARADVNFSDPKHGYTALMVSAMSGHTELCSLLLARGARKDAKNSCGQSALDFARSWGRTELEQLLQ